MKARFEGEDGKRRLIEAMIGNDLVGCDPSLAAKLAEVGELVELGKGTEFIQQGAPDNDIFFIIAGHADVYVNERYVATREPRSYVGEMALIDPSARRSASVVSRDDTVLLRVTEPDFHRISEEFPKAWKPIARTLAERLRQRAQFHRVPNPQPVLFLGSSVEGLRVAGEIQAKLKHEKVATILWTDDVFGPSSVSIDALLKMVEEADFAALVFGPDDKVMSRKTEEMAPRDNVVFELGLFMGGLNRERTFIIKEHKADIKIPSDLLGLTPITYVHHDPAPLAASIGPVALDIMKRVQALGVR